VPLTREAGCGAAANFGVPDECQRHLQWGQGFT
jgi:hypothetical protein